MSAITDSCSVCGRQIQREDTPLPASWAPAPWWHHMNEAQARACPTMSPVRPAALPADAKAHRRAAGYAAKWHAEHERAEPPRTAEPTNKALAECFAGCVRPAGAEFYPLIRLYIGAYAGDTTALAIGIEANPRFRNPRSGLFDDCAAEYGADVTGLAFVQACLKADQEPGKVTA